MLSKSVIGIVIIAWIIILLNHKYYKGEVIQSDITYYYSYLPATLIYHDLELKFVDHNPFLGSKIWPETAPNGNLVSKTTMGLALLWTPFFLAGHATALLLDYPPNGYGPTYYLFLYLGTLFYLVIGLLALRKVLLCYFNDKAVALTLLTVFFGTNLMYYAAIEPLMPHVFMFSFISLIIWYTIKWHRQPGVGNSIILGLLMGFIVLVRPIQVLIALIPILYNVYDKESFHKKILLVRKNVFNILVIIFAAALVYLPQLLYWKSITGNWLFYSYGKERFYFANPHIIEGLFSYRKGWLVYTPIMIFSIAGFFFLKKIVKQLFIPAILVFLLAVYVSFAWWCWWYGGSYGQRAFVDYYGLLALPMCALYQSLLSSKKIIKASFVTLSFLLIALNCFQTYQKKRGVIHYDGMTKEVYWMVFGRINIPHEFWNKLKQPDYEKARAGLPAD